MNDTDVKTVRLQPRQLYDILVACQTGPIDSGTDYIFQYGAYKDPESFSCAINDFNKIRQNEKGIIEITLEPLKQKNMDEEHIPYLHDVCENNEYFAHILGIDGETKITFSELLKNPSELLRKHRDLTSMTLANMYIGDTSDTPNELYTHPEPKKFSDEERSELKSGFKYIDYILGRREPN
jgi:hypothetical protein